MDRSVFLVACLQIVMGISICLWPDKWKNLTAELSLFEWQRKGWRDASRTTMILIGSFFILFPLLLMIIYKPVLF